MDAMQAAAGPERKVHRSLCALAAIDTAAFVAAAWLCLMIPESLEPWAHTAGTTHAAPVDSAARVCE